MNILFVSLSIAENTLTQAYSWKEISTTFSQPTRFTKINNQKVFIVFFDSVKDFQMYTSKASKHVATMQ